MKKFKIKDALTLGSSAGILGLSAANLGINYKRGKENTELQERQLKTLDRLTKSLDKVDDSLKSTPSQQSPRRIFIFKQKNNSHTADLAYKGGAIGGAIAGGSLPFLPNKIGVKTNTIKNTTITKDKKGNDVKNIQETIQEIENPDFKHPKFREKYNKYDSSLRNALIMVGGVAVGASLGALAGMIMDITDHITNKKSLNNRLLKDILIVLKKMGFNEGRDYTRDPKVAGLLKTKVAIVISKSSDELKLLINTVNDGKLKDIVKKISKNLPTMSTVTEKVTDRYNELNITTLTSNNGDATWVASIAEKFIKSGYPVYLIEVG